MAGGNRVRWLVKMSVLVAVGLAADFGSALASKGDRISGVRKSAPLLERKVLDLRFATFAQGIWTRDTKTCSALETIDQAPPGSAIAVFRGLLETPGRICLLYGAERGGVKKSQRAALNCGLNSGEETLSLVTLSGRGNQTLIVQDGEHPAESFKFCRTITPVIFSHQMIQDEKDKL